MLFVEKNDKRALLGRTSSRTPASAARIIFTRTKHGADKVTEVLERQRVSAEAIHGNKIADGAPAARSRISRAGRTRVLVATDIAARGIDVDGITHVINYELPNVPESYVHRIGRTARAGAAGVAISFCDSEERAYLRDIEKLIRKSVPVVHDHPFRSTVPAGTITPAAPRGRSGGHGGERRGGRNGGGGQARGGRNGGGRGRRR